MPETATPKLTEIGSDPSDTRASADKFRAVTMIDSCLYQVGGEVSTIAEARRLCTQVKPGHFAQIFDDKGQRYILYPTPELKEIGVNESFRRASPGKFRAVTVIDSSPYRIGEDVDTFDAAEELCRAMQCDKAPQFFQIYNDRGFSYL